METNQQEFLQHNDGSAGTNGPDRSRSEVLDHDWLLQRLQDGIREGCFPSAACAIGVGGLVLAMACAGEAPVPGSGVPVDEHTRFDMASLSKVIGTTMVALRAWEDGKIRLDETVRDFFPDAPADKAGITIRQLMTHTGGFEPFFRLDQLLEDPKDVVDCILAHPLAEAPGVRPIYSCMGYILLAKMLEKRLGASLNELADAMVFRPLGMLETGYSPDPASAVFAATEVDPQSGKPWIGIVHDENARFQRGISGNAGVFMPLRDGIRFAAMLARQGAGFLKPETLRMATRNETPGQDEHRGLGFHLAGTPDCFFSTAVPADCFGHTGFTGTSLLVEPGTGFWVLLLSNRVYPTRNSSALFPFRRKLHADSWRLFQAFSGTTGFPAPSAKVLPEEDRIWFDEYTEGGAYPEAAERTGSWLYRLLNLPEEPARLFSIWDEQLTPVCDEELTARLLDRSRWNEAYKEMEARIGADPDHLRVMWEELRIARLQIPRWQEKGIPPEIYRDTMKFMDRYLRDALAAFGRYRFTAGWWFPRQLAMELFRLGSLEFEFLPGEEGKRISVHIPTNASLAPEAIDDSFGRFRRFARQFYPEWADAPFYCDSWLLDPQLKEFLPASSRILGFQSRFTIISVSAEGPDALNWVFPGCERILSRLPEKTSLQRRMKAFLISGGKTGAAEGLIPGDFVD